MVGRQAGRQAGNSLKLDAALPSARLAQPRRFPVNCCSTIVLLRMCVFPLHIMLPPLPCVQARACCTLEASLEWGSGRGTSRQWAPTLCCSHPATQPREVGGWTEGPCFEWHSGCCAVLRCLCCPPLRPAGDAATVKSTAPPPPPAGLRPPLLPLMQVSACCRVPPFTSWRQIQSWQQTPPAAPAARRRQQTSARWCQCCIHATLRSCSRWAAAAAAAAPAAAAAALWRNRRLTAPAQCWQCLCTAHPSCPVSHPPTCLPLAAV
jgi:hypothetical protein